MAVHYGKFVTVETKRCGSSHSNWSGEGLETFSDVLAYIPTIPLIYHKQKSLPVQLARAIGI